MTHPDWTSCHWAVNMLYCFILVVCLSTVNAQMGAFDVVIRHFEECPDIGSGDIRLIVRMKKFNRTTTAADFNLTLQVPFDDQISIMFSLAQLTNGGFKQNFFSKRIEKACTSPNQLVPDLWKQILASMNRTRCPIPKGFYSVKDFTTKDELTKLRVFFFNKYRATQSYIRRGKLVGCIKTYVDVVPKRKH